MTEEVSAIVLAGGKGSRLRSEIGISTPKIMAQINGEPFVGKLLRKLENLGLRKVIFALGHLSHEVISYVDSTYSGGLKIAYSVEKHPLGTGGAVALASEELDSKYGLVVNGDTLVEIPLSNLLEVMRGAGDFLGVALLADGPESNSGTPVSVDGSTVLTFGNVRTGCSKGFYSGVTLCQRKYLSGRQKPDPPVGFEELYLMELLEMGRLGAVMTKEFLDYGTPDRFRKANG